MAAPANLAATESTKEHDKVELSWTAVEGASWYLVYQNTSDDPSTAKAIDSYEVGTSYTVTLASAGTYWFWVKAEGRDSDYNTVGSPLSEGVSYTFAGSGLAAPKYVTVARSSGKLNCVTVSWQNNAYKCWVYYNSADDTSTATQVGGSYGYVYSSSKDVFLPSDGTWYFWVVAEDGSGNKSGWSASASCQFTSEAVTPPEDVSAAQNSGKNSVRVRWKHNGADDYEVYYSTTNAPDDARKSYASAHTESGVSGTSETYKYADVWLYEAGTYYFWVQAVDGNDTTSDYSQAASCSFTVQVVQAPTGVAVTRSATDASAVTVSWTESADASYYNIYYNTTESTAGATEGASYVFGWSENVSEDVTLPSLSGTYWFWVKAVDRAEIESDYSTAVSITF